MANITLYYANEPVATMDLATVDQAKRIAQRLRAGLGPDARDLLTLHKGDGGYPVDTPHDAWVAIRRAADVHYFSA